MFYSFNQAIRRPSICATLIMFLGTSLQTVSLLAQANSVSVAHKQQAPDEIAAKVLIGLPGVAPNSEGILSYDSKNLRFGNEHGSIDIARKRIIGISSGDERVETGGTTGKIARVIIPYGGGLALGAVTHKIVGLLTIEFIDGEGQYHGAVFVLSTEDLASAIEKLDIRPPAIYTSTIEAPAACPAWKVRSNTVRVEMVEADLQSKFPAEDRVLLYERLVQQLKSEKTIVDVYRAGDSRLEATCAEFDIKVRAVAFNKGDQAVRASVGPLGHFVGTTKLNYHLTVAMQNGTSIVDEDMKKSEGSDSDSLNVTKTISKAVIKSLKKTRTQMRKAQMV